MGKEIKEITEYAFNDETGDAHITVYHLFPGVEVAYVSAAVCALWRSQMRFSTAAMRSRTAARI